MLAGTGQRALSEANNIKFHSLYRTERPKTKVPSIKKINEIHFNFLQIPFYFSQLLFFVFQFNSQKSHFFKKIKQEKNK